MQGRTNSAKQLCLTDGQALVVTDRFHQRFNQLLLDMDYGDPNVRPLLDLEGLKQWLPGRTELYEPLERAVDRAGFYDGDGRITASDYRP